MRPDLVTVTMPMIVTPACLKCVNFQNATDNQFHDLLRQNKLPADNQAPATTELRIQSQTALPLATEVILLDLRTFGTV